LAERGTHLGIPIGREVSLEDVWEGPLTKALQKIKNNFSLIRALPFSSRILFINVFIVSLFSYHGLFFILPTELWKKIKNAISKVVIPFNGGAFTYDSLVCAKKIFSLKLPLKDVWAFNISLLAVRSPLFKNPTQNYFSLPTIRTNYNMHIVDHRDAAAVDFWRSRHLPDGRLVPLSAPSSTEVYKILVDDVYLDDSADQVSKKISNYLQVYQPGLPATPPLDLLTTLTKNLSLVSQAPQALLVLHMSLVNNALATSRRMRHQNHQGLDQVAPCFFCGTGQDSLPHIFSQCGIINEARKIFFSELGLTFESGPEEKKRSEGEPTKKRSAKKELLFPPFLLPSFLPLLSMLLLLLLLPPELLHL